MFEHSNVENHCRGKEILTSTQ